MHDATIEDELLGTLHFDASIQSYRGTLDIGGQSVAVQVALGAEAGLGQSLPRARELVGRIDGLDTSAREFAAVYLTDLKNDSWREDDEGEISADDLISRLSLSGLTVEQDGDASIWYDDDDMFWGHSIQVVLKADDHFAAVHLAG